MYSSHPYALDDEDPGRMNGAMKYRVRSNTPVFGFFFFYTLDKAVCPYLAMIFGMKIWHLSDPTTETDVDELLIASDNVQDLQLPLSGVGDNLVLGTVGQALC